MKELDIKSRYKPKSVDYNIPRLLWKAKSYRQGVDSDLLQIDMLVFVDTVVMMGPAILNDLKERYDSGAEGEESRSEAS